MLGSFDTRINMEYRKFRANNIIYIVINYVKRLHSGENNKYQPEE